MASETPKICPPTPRKAPRRTDTPVMPSFVTSLVIECIGKISPNNSKQIILDGELLGKKIIQIEDTNLVVHMGEALDQGINRSYPALISQNGQVILTNCQLKTLNIIPSITKHYDPGADLPRVNTFCVINSSGERIDFTKLKTREEENESAKRIKSQKTEAAVLEWREKPLPVSLMFKPLSASESPPSDQLAFSVPQLNDKETLYGI